MRKLLHVILPFLLLTYTSDVLSQGSMMLAGGGGESAGGWSDSPYRWVVEHAPNRRIAVITYDNAATDWVPNYFKGFGAKAARNFIINSRSAADQQAVYDSLITYTGVFIKGGDQAKYYEYYKGTRVQKAIQEIYNNGGVISGTSAGAAIISPIVYTAQIASVDPQAALLDAYSKQITLANDFLKTLNRPYIFDTHFAERGRFGRLTAFMAKWYQTTGELAVGFGIDDHTAICIDKNGKATVYGTGTVSIVKNLNEAKTFDTSSPILDASNLTLAQIPHGCYIDMNSATGSGLSNLIRPKANGESFQSRILCTGTDYPTDPALEYFVNGLGNATDSIVIITGATTTRANDLKSKLMDKGAFYVSILQAITGNENNSLFQEKLAKAKKIALVANTYDQLMDFAGKPGNGAALLSKLKSPKAISLFVGDNARFAGKTVINKYTGFGYASYNGALEFRPGLSILKTTAIMPNAFFSAETYENTTTGLPYAMVKDTLRYGLYLSGSACAEFYYDNNDGFSLKNISGYFPLIWLENSGTNAGFVNQGPNASSRNIAGFEEMKLKYVGVGNKIRIGETTSGDVSFNSKRVKIYPNPANRKITFDFPEEKVIAAFYTESGTLVQKSLVSGNTTIDLKNFASGVYFIEIMNHKELQPFKLIVNKD